MSGIKIEDLRETLTQLEGSLLSGKKLILVHEEHIFIYNLNEVGIYSNKEQLEKKILSLYNDNFLTAIHNFKDIYFNPLEFYFAYEINEELFFSSIHELDSISLPDPVNAHFKYVEGKVTIIDGINGVRFDKEKLIELIQIKDIDNEHVMLEVPVKYITPEITSQKLSQMGINALMAQYSTEFNANLADRTNNLRIATEALNGTIVAPGEVFSFNETVGPRTTERGYRPSPIYVGDNILDGVGGGICQVSSTLYNAVLLADLQIIERRNHSLTVPYVELSRDATVAWGSIDFKFKNTTDSYIYIHGSIEKNKLAVELHGSKYGKTVVLKSEKLSTIPPNRRYIYDASLQADREVIITKGQPGYTSRLIKETYEAGQLIHREIVSTDRYLPTTTVIRRGTS
ncbi:VanW family protein [Desulfitibacter alkalitolerans]|uniref:VanW family protein n=1 Tax=Desulfitibacter alkalitolerans TaxID=264641 RepID=UPI00146FA8D4|nr:VanW family protein [Desulfitibacter alkalitolerans]